MNINLIVLHFFAHLLKMFIIHTQTHTHIRRVCMLMYVLKGVNLSLCVGVTDSCDGACGWRMGHT